MYINSIKSHPAIFIALTILLPTTTLAFMCPTNFSQIEIGDKIEDVASKCGAPDKEVKSTEEPNAPQEWNYYLPQTVETGTSQQTQGTMKASFAFDKDGKAINLTVNGIGVGATTICGPNISLGSSKDSVKSACGAPAFITKQEADLSSTDKPKKIVVYTYNGNPVVNLRFEDGILVSKE